MSTESIRYRLRRMERRAFHKGPAVAFLNPSAPGYQAAQDRVDEFERQGRRLVTFSGNVFKNRVHA